MTERPVVRVNEVMQMLDCSQVKAYKVMEQLNGELRKMGKIVMAGRVSRKYFMERVF